MENITHEEACAEYKSRDSYTQRDMLVRCRAVQEYLAFMEIDASFKELREFVVQKEAGQPITPGVEWRGSTKKTLAWAFVNRWHGFKAEHLEVLRTHFGVKG